MSASLDEVLADAQRRGFLGAGPLEGFIDHARGYLDGFVDSSPPGEVVGVDLGSGGGIPGLVLALAVPGSRWHLVERSRTRADWLTRSVSRLGLTDRVAVRHEPAETTGRSSLRGRCSTVVARGFGPPAVVAECAAPLLYVGGRAVCSDLDGSTRWDEEALGRLGLALVRRWRADAGNYVVLEQRRPCPGDFPRRPGVPARRPLF